jgi:hypothetical protein
MSFSEKANTIFRQATVDYHIADNVDVTTANPYPNDSVEHILYEKNMIDAVQWHLEDLIRQPDIEPQNALALKRRIDSLNQERTDLVELLDTYFLNLYADVKPLPGAKLNTESPAWALDRLSILALKIYHWQQEVKRTDIDAAHKDFCVSKLNILLEQRADLSASITQLLDDIAAGHRLMRVYQQMKMYNDPRLNPVLYNRKP